MAEEMSKQALVDEIVKYSGISVQITKLAEKIDTYQNRQDELESIIIENKKKIDVQEAQLKASIIDNDIFKE